MRYKIDLFVLLLFYKNIFGGRWTITNNNRMSKQNNNKKSSWMKHWLQTRDWILFERYLSDQNILLGLLYFERPVDYHSTYGFRFLPKWNSNDDSCHEYSFDLDLLYFDNHNWNSNLLLPHLCSLSANKLHFAHSFHIMFWIYCIGRLLWLHDIVWKWR